MYRPSLTTSTTPSDRRLPPEQGQPGDRDQRRHTRDQEADTERADDRPGTRSPGDLMTIPATTRTPLRTSVTDRVRAPTARPMSDTGELSIEQPR